MKVPTFKTTSQVFALATLSLLSACGSSGVTGDPAAALPQGDTNYEMPMQMPGGSTGGAPTMSAKMVGKCAGAGCESTASVSPPLRTDSHLVVQIKAQPATRNEQTPVYTNFTANYTCATFRVTLQIQSQENGPFEDYASVDTDRLSVAGTAGCAGSVASQSINFSPYLFAGHKLFKLKVVALTSNFNCTYYKIDPTRYPWSYGQVCNSNPMQSIYQYHVVNARLEAQVDDTTFSN